MAKFGINDILKGQCRLWAGAVDVLEQKAGVA